MKNHEFYWVNFKEDQRKETKPAQYLEGEMYIVGARNSIPIELFENIERIKPVSKMKTVYVAGAYRWKGSRWLPSVIGELLNIYKAWNVSRKVWLAGFAAICPHTNGMLMDRLGGTPEMFLKGDLDILAQCDYILMMEGWQQSAGATEERAFAIQQGIPVFYSVEALEGEHLWV
jgi:hypothetical protein